MFSNTLHQNEHYRFVPLETNLKMNPGPPKLKNKERVKDGKLKKLDITENKFELMRTRM